MIYDGKYEKNNKSYFWHTGVSKNIAIFSFLRKIAVKAICNFLSAMSFKIEYGVLS